MQDVKLENMSGKKTEGISELQNVLERNSKNIGNS
jgi:hypothetical protein